MSNAIQKFQEAKANLEYLKAWASLIGKEYHDGGGGVGSVVRASAHLTIYHQASNGATNYHDIPSCQDYIDRALLEKSGAIIGHAIYLAETRLQEVAREALGEVEEVTKAAKATT